MLINTIYSPGAVLEGTAQGVNLAGGRHAVLEGSYYSLLYGLFHLQCLPPTFRLRGLAYWRISLAQAQCWRALERIRTQAGWSPSATAPCDCLFGVQVQQVSEVSGWLGAPRTFNTLRIEHILELVCGVARSHSLVTPMRVYC
jgi:hypothetical protein